MWFGSLHLGGPHKKKENSLQRVRFRFLITDGLAFHDSTMPNEDPIQLTFRNRKAGFPLFKESTS